MRCFIGCFLLLVLSLVSCRSTKDITYFQAARPDLDLSMIDLAEVYAPRIQPGDILSITVSSRGKEASEVFNPIPQPTNQQRQVGVLQPAHGFKVDSTGYITFPDVGNLKAKGLTTSEFSALLTQELEKYIEVATVIVRLANFQVTVMGEVARPSVYHIPNEKITITEAIALAGDIGIYGKKKNVMVIREEGDHRSIARLDLTGRDFFFSPYYYLHPGDIVYVEATSGRLTSSDRIYQLSPIVISALTFLMLLVNNLK